MAKTGGQETGEAEGLEGSFVRVEYHNDGSLSVYK
jgi:hypothetical protein